MAKSTVSSFRALNRRHLNESRSKLRFVVKSVNKDGSISKMRLTDNDYQHNAFATEEQADARRVQLEELNPGSRFAVCPL